MKENFKKFIDYFTNRTKRRGKLEMASNWLTVVLPIGLFTLMMIYAANSKGKSMEELQHSTFGAVVGFLMILWAIIALWWIGYKIYKRITKFSKNNTDDS